MSPDEAVAIRPSSRTTHRRGARIRRRRSSSDARDNLTQVTNARHIVLRRFRYNVDNRLIEVRNQADTLIASYAYDPFGRRVQKTVGTTTTYYLYAEEGLIAELDATGSVTTGYGWKPHGVWGTDPLFIRQGGVVGYYHNDHLGTPQAVTSASGVLLWSARYDAFGKATVETAQITNNLRFPGQYFDAETGLHYNWHRYYDPGAGRYITSDPIGLKGGLNVYLYAITRPMTMIDVDGLRWIFVGWTVDRPSRYWRWWTDYRNVNAVCKDDCTGETRKVLARTFQTRPMCINEKCLQPSRLDPTRDPTDSLVDAVFDIGEGVVEAARCGSMSEFQCFVATTPCEVGQQFCEKLE